MKPIIRHINYFGFNHILVNKQFGGDLTYLGDICHAKDRNPYALYRAKNPDRSKGHKEFVLLWVHGSAGAISGMELAEVKKHVKHAAVQCTACGDVIYSVHHHDYHSCSCGMTSIDGGRDYVKTGWTAPHLPVHGTVNLLTGKFRKSRKK